MLTAAGSAFSAAGSGTDALVSTQWLMEHLNDPKVVVLDVRTFPKYIKSHIPGAVRAFGPWRSMNSSFVGFMAPPAEEMQEMLRGFGVSDDSFVILYDQGMTSSDTAKSARALWTLNLLGHEKCAILDGGFNAWEQKSLPVTYIPAIPSRGNFTAKVNKRLAITLDELEKGGSKRILVDNREPFHHFGHEKKAFVKKFGHIKGSLLMPGAYMTIGGQNFSPAYLRSMDELKEMVRGVGIPDDHNAEIVVYSNTGEEAALGYFVLAKMLGYRNVRLFDGSMLEAARAPGVEIVRYSWGWHD
jgi:thiosulfate/3-mercaptopyruvate sulfurtransferase